MRSLSSLAIIPDGNRRFARKAGMPLAGAYAKGFDKMKSVLDWARESDVKSATFWALSLDNFQKRSKIELEVLFRLLGDYVQESLSTRELSEKGVRVRFFGRRDLLPDAVDKKLCLLEKDSVDNEDLELNVAIAYGGRDELFHAAQELARDYKAGITALSPEEFEKRLYCSEHPELIIRTGATQRLSGFLPWQSGYSELFFSQQLWPEFSRDEFDRALAFFEESDSRKGK